MLLLITLGCRQEYHKEETEAVRKASAVLEASERGYLEAAARSQQAVKDFYSRPSWKEQWKEWFERQEDLMPLQYRQFSSLLYRSTGMAPDNASETDLRAMRDSLTQAPYLADWNKDQSTAINSRSLRTKGLLFARAGRALGDSSSQYLEEYAQLQNDFASLGGYPNYYAYRADAYQRSGQQMTEWRHELLLAVRPLMEELHTWLRYELAKKYQNFPPEQIPVYWLNSWKGYEWFRESKGLSGMGKPIDGLELKQLWQRQGGLLDSCGMPALPESAVRLGASPKGGLCQVRTFPSSPPEVRVDSMATGYSGWRAMLKARIEAQAIASSQNPDVPLLLQQPACPAFIPAWQKGMEQLFNRRLLSIDSLKAQDSTLMAQWERRLLLQEALQYIPKLVFYAGVVGDFEQSLYGGNLSASTYTPRWNTLMRQYLGINPNQESPEDLPALLHKEAFLSGGAMDTTLSIAMQYQLQQRLSLSDSTGRYFQRFFYPGASLQWEEIYEEIEMASPDGEALQMYFAPLLAWLEAQNARRPSVLPSWNLEED